MYRLLPLLFVVACNQSHPRLELFETKDVKDVAALVTQELARASHDHKQLIVYIGASWCEPCQRFHDAAAKGQLDSSFGNVRLLVFDADRDGEALGRAGYDTHLIPYFALPYSDGTASNRHIEGSIKGDGAVAEITPRLKGLLTGP